MARLPSAFVHESRPPFIRVRHFDNQSQASAQTTESVESTESKTSKAKSIKSETTECQSSSPLEIFATRAKKLILARLESARRLASYYRNHISDLLSTNVSSDRSETPRAAEAGSASYGDPMATEEELRRQIERNHLDYVFYLGHNDSFVNLAPFNNRLRSPSFEGLDGLDGLEESQDEPIDVSVCPDASTFWNEAYMAENDMDMFDRIDKNTRLHMQLFHQFQFDEYRQDGNL